MNGTVSPVDGRIIVPTPSAPEISISIEPTRGADGKWRSAFWFISDPLYIAGSLKFPNFGDEKAYDSRRECLLERLCHCVAWLDSELNNPSGHEVRQRARADVLAFFRELFLQEPEMKPSAAKRGTEPVRKPGDDIVAAGRAHLQGKPAAADPQASEPPVGRLMNLPLEKIERVGNPRKYFDEAALETLTSSVKERGLLQPLLVRELDGPRYHLADGGRRYIAAERAFLREVPCNVRAMTDQEFHDAQLIANLQREDLNPMEEAQAFFDQTKEGGGQYTQTELAEKLGVTQGHVGNRIALLKLPAEAAKLVITRDMPPTHARELLAYADRPGLSKAILKHWEPGISLKGWADAVKGALHVETREMDAKDYWGPKFEVTPELREKLQVIEVPSRYGKGTCLRATNSKLYDKLQKEAEAERRKKAEAQASSRGKNKSGKGPAKPKEESDAEFGRKLSKYRDAWLAMAISERLDGKVAGDLVGRLWVIMCAFCDSPYQLGRQIFQLAGGAKRKEPKDGEIFEALASVKAPAWPDFARELLKKQFVSDEGKPDSPFWEDGQIAAAAELLGIKLATFRADTDFLELWSDRRLWELAQRDVFPRDVICEAEDLKGVKPGEFPNGRNHVVERLVAAWPKQGWLPIELATVDTQGRFKAEKPSKNFALKS